MNEFQTVFIFLTLSIIFGSSIALKITCNDLWSEIHYIFRKIKNRIDIWMVEFNYRLWFLQIIAIDHFPRRQIQIYSQNGWNWIHSCIVLSLIECIMLAIFYSCQQESLTFYRNNRIGKITRSLSIQYSIENRFRVQMQTYFDWTILFILDAIVHLPFFYRHQFVFKWKIIKKNYFQAQLIPSQI